MHNAPSDTSSAPPTESDVDFAPAWFEASREAIVLTDAADRIVSVNPAFTTITGYTREDVVGRPPAIFDALLRDPVLSPGMQEHLMTGERWDVEFWDRRKNGEPYCASLSIRTLDDGARGIVRRSAVFSDITERKRAEARIERLGRARRVMAECSRVLVHATTEAELMREMCEILVSSGGYRQAWIGLPGENADAPVAIGGAAGYRAGYLAAVGRSRDGTGRRSGVMGQVIATGRAHISQNVPAASAAAEGCAGEPGYQASATLPLMHQAHPIGGISIYAVEPDAFDGEEIELLQALADDIAFGIAGIRTRLARERAEAELARRNRLTALLETLARAANEAVTAEDAMQACLERICEYGAWTLGHVAIFAPGRSGGVPQISLWRCSDSQRYGQFMRYSDAKNHLLEPGIFISRVLREHRSLWLTDIAGMPGHRRLEMAAGLGLHAAFAFPVVARDEMVAFLEFFSENARPPDALLLEGIGTTASQLARVVERGRAAAERARLAAIVESASDAIVTRDFERTILTWNPAAERLFGWRAEEAIGCKIDLIVPPDRRGENAQLRERVQRGLAVANYDTVRIAKGGRRIDVSLSQAAIRNDAGEVKAVSLTFRDITERVVSDRRRAMEHTVTRILAESKLLGEALTRVIRTVCEAMNWAYGARWVWSEGDRRLHRAEWWSDFAAAFAAEDREDGFILHLGSPDALLHEAWLAEAFTWRAGVQDEAFPRGSSCARFGLRSAYWFPVRAGSAVIGLMEFFGREVQPPDDMLLQITESIGRLVVLFIQRKLADEARAQLATIVENANDAIIGRTLDGTIVSWNAAAERLFGYSAAEAVGSRLAALVPPELEAEHLENRRRVRAGEPISLHESVRVTKQGRRIAVSLSVSPIRDESGKVTGISAICRDETERKRAEATRAWLAAIVENANDAIIGRDLDGTIISWNAAAERMFGYTAAEALGCDVRMNVTPKSARRYAEHNERLKRGESIAPFESRRITRDGRTLDVMTNLSPIKNEQGEVIGAAVIVSDMTERKRSEQEILKLNADLERRVAERTRQLEAINRELESFCYSVSHDLRAPLRGIDGFSQILLERYGEQLDAVGTDCLQRIRRATLRMSELIDDLLQLSRLSTRAVTEEPVDLSRLAHTILHALQEGDPGRTVGVDVEEGIVVRGDAGLLKIAFENLLGNAWKFTGKQADAMIRFGAARHDNGLVVFVQDNGAGFNMKYAHKLFGAFQRLHAADEFEGTGIGLATVQRIVNLHGGRIWADARPGAGAIFHVLLPAPDGGAMIAAGNTP